VKIPIFSNNTVSPYPNGIKKQKENLNKHNAGVPGMLGVDAEKKKRRREKVKCVEFKVFFNFLLKDKNIFLDN